MFAQYFNHPLIPFEVLLYIFEYLDRKDLPSVCVASKRLNSAATPVLYRNVTCGPVSFDSHVSSTMLYSWHIMTHYLSSAIRTLHR